MFVTVLMTFPTIVAIVLKTGPNVPVIQLATGFNTLSHKLCSSDINSLKMGITTLFRTVSIAFHAVEKVPIRKPATGTKMLSHSTCKPSASTANAGSRTEATKEARGTSTLFHIFCSTPTSPVAASITACRAGIRMFVHALAKTPEIKSFRGCMIS